MDVICLALIQNYNSQKHSIEKDIYPFYDGHADKGWGVFQSSYALCLFFYKGLAMLSSSSSFSSFYFYFFCIFDAHVNIVMGFFQSTSVKFVFVSHEFSIGLHVISTCYLQTTCQGLDYLPKELILVVPLTCV